MSFVKPPTSAEGEEEDNTPWAVLACFAMYKLFNRWMTGADPCKALIGLLLLILMPIHFSKHTSSSHSTTKFW